MTIKLLFISLFIIACGREVRISNKLAESSQLKEADLKKFQKSGSLIRGNPDQIQYEGKLYKISAFSSHSSLEFVKKIPNAQQIEVIFTGGVSKDKSELVLETVIRK